MIKHGSLLMMLALLAISLVACSGAGAAPPAAGSSLVVKLATEPDPPAVGDVAVVVTVADAAGKPVDNAAVSVLASHTGHGGMEMQGNASAQGSGRYALTANMSMSGDWLVTVEVRAAGADVVRQDFKLPVK